MNLERTTSHKKKTTKFDSTHLFSSVKGKELHAVSSTRQNQIDCYSFNSAKWVNNNQIFIFDCHIRNVRRTEKTILFDCLLISHIAVHHAAEAAGRFALSAFDAFRSPIQSHKHTHFESPSSCFCCSCGPKLNEIRLHLSMPVAAATHGMPDKFNLSICPIYKLRIVFRCLAIIYRNVFNPFLFA